jgi:RNA polymerase sigma factor (sigma-70 family)
MEAEPLESVVSKASSKHLSDAMEQEREKLLRFISRRTPTNEDAEDILQDVFFEFLQSTAIENTAAWLYRVARNKITDWYRKMKPSRLDDITTSAGSEEEPLLLADIIPSLEDSPDRKLLYKLITDVLTEALAELPPAQRDVFVLHEIEGLSMNEIAEMSGSNLKTVISRKRYAVIHLKQRLKTLYNELLTN